MLDFRSRKDVRLLTRREFLRENGGLILSSMLALDATKLLAYNALKEPQVEKRNVNPKMQYRRLGRTNLMVSILGMGGALNYGPDSLNDDPAKTQRTTLLISLQKGNNASLRRRSIPCRQKEPEGKLRTV